MLAHASFVVRTVVKAFYSIFHRIGIEGWFTEHRIAEQARPQADVVDIVSGAINLKDAQEPASATAGIRLGDKVALVFADGQKRLSARVPKAAMISKKAACLRRKLGGCELQPFAPLARRPRGRSQTYHDALVAQIHNEEARLLEHLGSVVHDLKRRIRVRKKRGKW